MNQMIQISGVEGRAASPQAAGSLTPCDQLISPPGVVLESRNRLVSA